MENIYKTLILLITLLARVDYAMASEKTAPKSFMCPELNNDDLKQLYDTGQITKTPSNSDVAYKLAPGSKEKLNVFYYGWTYTLLAKATGTLDQSKKNTCIYNVESTNHYRTPYVAEIVINFEILEKENPKEADPHPQPKTALIDGEALNHYMLGLILTDKDSSAFYKMIVADTNEDKEEKVAHPIPFRLGKPIIYNSDGFETPTWDESWDKNLTKGGRLSLKAGRYRNSEKEFQVNEDIPIGYSIILPQGPIKGVIIDVYGGNNKGPIAHPASLLRLEEYLLGQNIAVIKLNLVDKLRLEVNQDNMPEGMHDILHASINHFFQTLQKHPEEIHPNLTIPRNTHICLHGASFGGRTSVRQAELYPDTFDGYISHDGGLSNSIGVKSDIQELVGGIRAMAPYLAPMEDRDESIESYEMKPDERISKIKQPVLLIHNIDDNNVNIQVSLHFYQAAIKSGKKHLVDFYVTESSNSNDIFFNKTHFSPNKAGTKAFEEYGKVLSKFILNGPNKFHAENKLTYLEAQLYSGKYYQAADALNVFISEAFTVYMMRNKNDQSICQKGHEDDAIEKNIEREWQDIYRPIFLLMKLKGNNYPSPLEKLTDLQNYIDALNNQGIITDKTISNVLRHRFQQIVDYNCYQLKNACTNYKKTQTFLPQGEDSSQKNVKNDFCIRKKTLCGQSQKLNKEAFSTHKSIIDLYRNEITEHKDFEKISQLAEYFTPGKDKSWNDQELDKHAQSLLKAVRKYIGPEIKYKLREIYYSSPTPENRQQYLDFQKLTDSDFYEKFKDYFFKKFKSDPDAFHSFILDEFNNIYLKKHTFLKYILTNNFAPVPASPEAQTKDVKVLDDEENAKNLLIETLKERARLKDKCRSEKLYPSTTVKANVSSWSFNKLQIANLKKVLSRITPIFARDDRESLHAQSYIKNEFSQAMNSLSKIVASTDWVNNSLDERRTLILNYIALDISSSLLSEDRDTIIENFFEIFKTIKSIKEVSINDVEKLIYQLLNSFASPKIRRNEVIDLWKYVISCPNCSKYQKVGELNDSVNSDFSHKSLRYSDFSERNVSRSNFVNADFMGSDFSRANLSESNFTNANLAGADFTGATLRGANFTNANLTGCKFNGADLTNTNLTNANFTESDLSDANVTGANLAETNLQETILLGTVFADNKKMYTASFDYPEPNPDSKEWGSRVNESTKGLPLKWKPHNLKNIDDSWFGDINSQPREKIFKDRRAQREQELESLRGKRVSTQ